MDAAISAIATEPLDWLRALYIAEKELAATALWRSLERSGMSTRMPTEIAERMRRNAMVTDFRMMRLGQRLRDTLRTLEERGIPVMLLKGAALGALLDPTFRERPMVDLDLLVHSEDAARAREAIIAAGWPQSEDPTVHELLENHHHLPPFIDPVIPDLRLELHLALLPADNAFRLDGRELWSEARSAPAPFASALVPSPEHLLFHTCTHFAWAHTMRFGAWRSLRLANALITSGMLDWERFVALAVRAGGASSCHWTLRLGRRLAGIEVPDAVLDPLAVPPQAWLREVLERYFIADLVPGEGIVSPSVRLSRFLWRLAMRPGPDGGVHGERWDHDTRWAAARDATGAAGGPRRSRRMPNVRHWWEFARRTLVSLD